MFSVKKKRHFRSDRCQLNDDCYGGGGHSCSRSSSSSDDKNEDGIVNHVDVNDNECTSAQSNRACCCMDRHCTLVIDEFVALMDCLCLSGIYRGGFLAS